ncbi:Uncharacterized protein TCM_034220 isoform 1 [Theobroma cacao]|uniref:Uncharacterized protein isoform 1 n=2 Tax=Theobroma cacao TaxID=3641 RepID=A0A061FCE7_THECC|nr:Uncharacterized protein TCM_034220 isoform 1 [Theobroma cacao]
MVSTEMDKSRDVRRGTSRFSRQQVNTNKQQQTRPNLLFGFAGGVVGVGGGGNFVCLEKAKREKIRRLSSVNGNTGSHSPCPNSNQHCETEMGSCCCDLSSDNRENQCPSHSRHSSSLITNSTNKRFKVPKKFLNDCNVVDHASVPRKLRSAMKKRSRESISPPSPDSQKLNHTLDGVESHKKDGVKKPKLNLKRGESNWSRKSTVPGPITKDEEEVAETLYALAGMFPDSDSMDKNKLSGESIEVKPSAPPEAVESPVTAIEVKQEDTNSVCCPQAAKSASPIDESSHEAAKLNSLNEPTIQDQPDLPDSKKSTTEPAISISQMRLNTTIPSKAKREPGAEKSSCFTGNFHVLSDQSLETGLKQHKQQVTTPFERKPEMAFGVTAFESQIAQQRMIKEPKKNGLALWPGLSSTVPLGARSPGFSQPSATKIPSWLDAAMCGPRPCSLESGSSTGKVSKVTMDKKSMKRCAAHVYISCIIRNLQMQDSEDSILQQSLQLKPHVGLKRTALLYPNNRSNLRNGINDTTPSSSSGNSVIDRNSCEARSGIQQPKMLHQDQPQVASASGMHTSKKQSFDFLSLLAGDIGKEANNSSNKAGKGIESLPQLQVPYLHSLPPHQPLVPFSIPPTRYSSSAHTDQLSTATAARQVQLQLPQCLSNPFCGPPYTSHSGVSKQHQHQQQQRLWATHLAAQYRPAGTSAVLTQYPSWQNGKPESSMLMPCAQTVIPPHSTLDAVGPKYHTVPQHLQPIIEISSSLPPARVKRQDHHHLPSVYEGTSGGLRAAGGPPPLQLLCNERL